jgi:hypothetical protein
VVHTPPGAPVELAWRPGVAPPLGVAAACGAGRARIAASAHAPAARADALAVAVACARARRHGCGRAPVPRSALRCARGAAAAARRTRAGICLAARVRGRDGHAHHLARPGGSRCITTGRARSRRNSFSSLLAAATTRSGACPRIMTRTSTPARPADSPRMYSLRLYDTSRTSI